MNEAVVFDRVVKSFGAVRAVDEVSFDVRQGEMFGLIGPDGAGKTTTIRLMCGLLAPSSGRVTTLGLAPIGQHRKLTRSVGYFSQRFSLYGDLSVDENIAFFAEIHGLRRYQDRRDRLLEMMQLTPFRDRLADRLSGGMKQKLALACTLVHEPRAIFLDEPTTGVDPVSRREFWKLLSEFLSQGITIVMATPYLDEAERCARVALLDHGRLLAADTPASLREQLPGRLFEVIAQPQPLAIERLAALDGVQEVQAFGERLHVRVAAQGVVDVRRLEATLKQAGVEVTQVRAIPALLEDVFINYVSAQDRAEPGSAATGKDR